MYTIRVNRRSFLLASAAAFGACGRPAEAPARAAIDAHIHLFARDRTRFPYHPAGTYQPEPQDLDDYAEFVRLVDLDGAIVVHPEPYQDDHSYLLHCFENEPRPGFFKGTCLFDPIDPATPGRIRELMDQAPGRIVALRIHAMNQPGEEPLASGPIKNRDLASPEMDRAWQATGELGLAIQMHFLPHHAPEIETLAARHPGIPVILDHLGRSGMGTAEDAEAVLRLARLGNTHIKFSGVRYASQQDWPYEDAKPLVRRFYDAFGPQRILAGGFGYDVEAFGRAQQLIELMFDNAEEEDLAAIRAGNSRRLFQFGTS